MILNIKTFPFGKHGPDNPEKLVGKGYHINKLYNINYNK
jgi:hypothetical protein